LKDSTLHPRIEEKARKISQDSGYDFCHIEKAKLTHYAKDFRYVYNKAWSKFKGVGEMSEEQAFSLLKRVKPIMDERLIWFGYYKDEPIAIFIMIPEMNQLFKYANGKLNHWSKLKIYLMKKLGYQTKALGLIFGVIPDFQGKGVEGAIVQAFAKVAEKPSFPYKDMEMNWIGDFNPKMMHVAEQVGGEIRKIHHTYRLHFDSSKTFERAPMLD
jgi:GNAT superfamily N-acetyltransferase